MYDAKTLAPSMVCVCVCVCTYQVSGEKMTREKGRGESKWLGNDSYDGGVQRKEQKTIEP